VPKAKLAVPATAAPATMMMTAQPVPMSVGAPLGVPPPNIPSNHPDQFVSVGLANNFNGRVQSLAYLARKIEAGKQAKEKTAKEGIYELAVELSILADDRSLGKDGIVTDYIKADVLTQWVPSRTDPVWVSVPGEGQYGGHWQYTPAGTIQGMPATLDMYELLALGKSGFPTPDNAIDPATGQPKTAVLPPDDWKGWFLIPGKNNSREGLMKGTKWNHFTTELERTGYRTMAPQINWGDFRQFLIGVYGTWVRMEFTFSGGSAPPQMPGQQGNARKIETLCLAKILDLGPISGAGGPITLSTPAPAPAVAPVVTAPVAAVQVPAPTPATPAASPLGGKDPAVVSAAMDKMLGGLVAAKVASGAGGATQQEAATLVYNELTSQGLDAALGLRWMNEVADDGWMLGDERPFAYDQVAAKLLPLG
jgi:hypothetical protein